MKSHTRMVLVVAAVLLATDTVNSTAAVAEPPAAVEYQIGTFNMAGGNKHHGSKGPEAPEALVRSIQERGPAFVAVQEGCADWSDHLRARLGGTDGSREHAVFFNPVKRGISGPDGRLGDPGVPDEALADATCDKKPVAFGNGVIVRTDVFGPAQDLRAEEHPLTSAVMRQAVTEGGEKAGRYATKERREMFCVRSEARRMAACSVHLTHDDRDLRIAEASTAQGILRDAYAGYTTLLGGDFNDDPLSATADQFYAPGYERGAQGEFKEVDSPCGNEVKRGFTTQELWWPYTYCRSGEATLNGDKIDALYVPLSVEVKWADATSAQHSDHVPLWAGVMLRA
ncbi:endonuclease/exonuclease/phosphatase family protein [Streptomyces sp. NPDC056500]|uniref:endonuclease/exonuclease/phosphatase family protein n=1 Tax=Streptomyces sp. NPDC056500 TaxID=3345840 RepID=UPI00369A59DE